MPAHATNTVAAAAGAHRQNRQFYRPFGSCHHAVLPTGDAPAIAWDGKSLPAGDTHEVTTSTTTARTQATPFNISTFATHCPDLALSVPNSPQQHHTPTHKEVLHPAISICTLNHVPNQQLEQGQRTIQLSESYTQYRAK